MLGVQGSRKNGAVPLSHLGRGQEEAGQPAPRVCSSGSPSTRVFLGGGCGAAWEDAVLTSSARFLFPAGLWLYLAGSSLPCLTLIGSPNFGYRSVHRDLEAQIAIVTENQALQQQLHQVGGESGGGGVELGAQSNHRERPPVSHSLAAVSRCPPPGTEPSEEEPESSAAPWRWQEWLVARAAGCRAPLKPAGL